MNSSLDKLVQNLPDEDFKYLVEEFGSEKLELLKQKVAYPYEYTKKDVLLLADLFEKFINTCLKFYGLNPSHYFSSSGLS